MLCLVAQSCPTLCDPMDCSPPGFSVLGGFPSMNTRAGCHALLQGIFLTQVLNLGLPHYRRILYCLSHQGSPWILEWLGCPYSRGIFPTQELNWGLWHCWQILYQGNSYHNIPGIIPVYVYVSSVSQPYPTVCDPVDYSPPGSSVRGISQARTLKRVAHFLLQGNLPDPVIKSTTPVPPELTGRFFTTESPGKPHHFLCYTVNPCYLSIWWIATSTC